MNINLNKNLLISISSLTFTIICILAYNVVDDFGENLNWYIFTNNSISSCIFYSIFIWAPIVVLKVILKRKVSLEDLGLKPYNSAIKYICTGLIITTLYVILNFTIICIKKNLNFEGFGFSFFTTPEVLVSIKKSFFVSILSAVCEDIFFRGTLCNYLSKFKGNAFGIIISSVIFSLFHCVVYYDIKSFIFAFYSGVIFAYFFTKTKSLYLPISIHFTINFLTFLTGPQYTNLESARFLVFIQNVSSADLNNTMFAVEIILYFVFMGIYLLIDRLIIKSRNKNLEQA